MSPRTEPRELVFAGGKIRCVLVHDHVLFRQGMRRLLEDEVDIEVVGEAGNAAECLRKVYELRPDVLVVDAGTFGLPAPEAELCVARESSRTRIVFLNMQEQAGSRFGGVRTATGGCAVRHTSAEELVKMIRNLCGDRIERQALSRRDPQRYAEAFLPQERTLTARETEVLKLLAEGKTVRAAATVLGLSSKTVDAHKFNLMRKLGVHNKAELVMWAIQMKVIKVPVNF